MPVEAARASLAAATTFEAGYEGGFEMVRGVSIRPADRVWAALLSRPNGTELVREAGRLVWRGWG
jgi:hypothetical protein